MRTKIGFLLGAGAGYVLGARAGRERYEQIARSAREYWESPKVQQTVGDLEEKATGKAKGLVGAAQQRAKGGAQPEPEPAATTTAYDISGPGAVTIPAGSNGQLP